MRDPPSPDAIFHTDTLSIDSFGFPADEPQDPHSALLPQRFASRPSRQADAAAEASGRWARPLMHAESPTFDQSWSLSQEEPTEQTHFGRASALGSSEQQDFDPFSLDILPDVPGGSESVDQLAVHIPVWPHLRSPQIKADNQPKWANVQGPAYIPVWPQPGQT